ncbi:MAG: MBL fold metallo-hydrolase [Phormidesmis sp.]
MTPIAQPPSPHHSLNTAQAPVQALSPASKVSVHFWGVRGSVPTPAAANQRYGGNTLCVEVLMGDQRLIFDGGTGLVNLGQHLQKNSQKHSQKHNQKPGQKHSQKPAQAINAHILFTHTQWDRIQGFPFFQPAFTPGNHFTVYGGTAPNGASIKHCLTDQMLQPHFALPLQNMLEGLTFRTLADRTRFNIGDVTVETLKINPKTEAFGYRLSWQGYTLVYATDTLHEPVSKDMLALADQADLLIYDGTYLDLKYLCSPVGEAGATQPWKIGVDIAQQANIKQLALVHHSPVQDDATLDRLQQEVRGRFPLATVACEGMTI